ncbi:hypothetical protein DUI87_31573 [Hirundo rustica rustica]|uniref:Uncharacterized protein n=1 Tax=Hirundo rustica rustica TaxID=333673 RepID=A0A3M0IT82_HIRRU|nr:hypothetical protein DUI87_31573 [Hirundo rustica rustica]
MGSSLSQQLCCVVCERCRQQEAADAEPSETKPILQSPRDTRTFLDTQPPTPALKVPKQGSKDLAQDRQPSADALEENGEPCSAADPVGRAEGWEAAWNPMDFFVAPADEEVEGEVEDLTQQEKGDKTEEETQPVPDVPVGDTALGAELGAQGEQPGTEGAPCAGITLQGGNLSLTELPGEAEPGQGREPEPLLGRDSVLCAVQVPGQPEPCLCAEPLEGTGRAEAAETSPRPAQRAELTCLVETVSLLTLQSSSEVIARGVTELCSTSPVSWEPLCPQWGSLEPPNQLLELLKQGSVSPAQGVGSRGRAGLGEILQQPQDGARCELGQEGSRGFTPGPEAEPQHRVMQPGLELPEEPAAVVPVPVKQEAELPRVPLSLPEVLGSSGEMEAENDEA